MILAGGGQEARRRERAKLGSLKGQVVAPKTLERYKAAVNRFFKWTNYSIESLPSSPAALDALVGDFIEELWCQGDPRSYAADTLCGLQHFLSELKRQLPGSWRLLGAWQRAELPVRSPPMLWETVSALAGWALTQKQPIFAAGVLVAYQCLLRTGELLCLTVADVFFNPSKDIAVLDLGAHQKRQEKRHQGNSRTGRRTGGAPSQKCGPTIGARTAAVSKQLTIPRPICSWDAGAVF